MMKGWHFRKKSVSGGTVWRLRQFRHSLVGGAQRAGFQKWKRVILGLLLTCGQAVLFSLQQQHSPWLPLLVVLPGLFLGISWHLLERPEFMLRGWISNSLDRVLAGFCLFFLYLILYIPLVSLTVSYPAGLLIGLLPEAMDLTGDYMLYSVNSVFVMVAFSWYQWWRTTGRGNS
jgi:lipoprotein signal peptidase